MPVTRIHMNQVCGLGIELGRIGVRLGVGAHTHIQLTRVRSMLATQTIRSLPATPHRAIPTIRCLVVTFHLQR